MFVKEIVNRLEIDLTGSCNAKCPLCARNYKSTSVQYKSRHLDEITAQLDEYPNLKLVHLVGAYSEPTLYKDFLNLCHYLVGRNVALEVCTNGDTHDPEWWGKLGEILTEKDSVYFSVCGSTQELHETYRVNCSLENLLENARAFRKANKYGVDYIQHIKFEYNAADLDSPRMKEILAEFSNINLTETLFTRPHDIYKDPYNLDKLEAAKEMQHKYNVIGKYAERNWNNKDKKKHQAACCSIEENSIHVRQDGKVYPCYVWMEESGIEDWDGDYDKITNLNYECCKYCEKNTKKLFKMMGCEFL